MVTISPEQLLMGTANDCESGASMEPSDQSPTHTHTISTAEDFEPCSLAMPQLQYHHDPVLRESIGLDDRVGASAAFMTDLSDHNIAPARPFNMTRPLSQFSDRASSPAQRERSTGAHTRSSTPRNSPDNRRLSYAELLKASYPQPGPAPVMLDNSRLRDAVGHSASLLSPQKTLEMYRHNVKKTDDLSIQYSFAVFLITNAQEQQRSEGTRSRNNAADTSSSNSRELIREAHTLLQKLSNAGYPFAQYYLADGYASGLFSPGKEDYAAAFPLFVLAAKHGHAEAAFRTGLCYEFGWGCHRDTTKAVQFLRMAASKSHPGAMTRLGRACLSGDLGEKRYREGLKWLKLAAESADTLHNAAPYHLGCLYETGYGDDVFKDESYAAELFTEAAELGHAEANYRMGMAYEHGTLTCPHDPALSVHFYTGAANRGHAGAMLALCAWYMVGASPVLEANHEEAFAWAHKAAKLGLVEAQYAVGYFREVGIGCRRDILDANVWYVAAADAGDARARRRLRVIRAATNGEHPEITLKQHRARQKADDAGGGDCKAM